MNMTCAIARIVLTEVFDEHIVGSIAIHAVICTLLDSVDGHRAVRGALECVIRVKGSLATYIHSLAGVNLLAENVLYWFA